ncbi:UNVERIFIED_ORG: CRP-like cAMP-binding protein [Zoogloea ramigera]|uniref:Crp/Fnr family transcriptional regulator n=1 Tax=Duganella zoogloeoides TaxID=75659 RepID=A0ABZ0Y1W0_9BURK|nr:Crp/Fnr family transcriptional regulator [Duganella zoogloeoides]WQH06010.1 Crp/Fnr family transcriptional regulator [Duganella zoogloeoides]
MHTHHHHLAEDDRSPTRALVNRLLSSLPEEEQGQLARLGEIVKVDVGDVLYEPGQTVRHVYFPLDCLLSLLAVAEGRMTLEVGSVGREGMIGAPVVLGHELAQVRAVVQRAGRAVRIDAGEFRLVYARMEPLQRLLHRYTDTLLAQAIQIAVCSRFHVLEARLARSLLITRDRLQSDKFHLTHEFLAHALGVRRVGVTKAASALQNQKLISYSRGNIEILDAAGLEAVSCRCYELVKDEGLIGISNVFV